MVQSALLTWAPSDSLDTQSGGGRLPPCPPAPVSQPMLRLLPCPPWGWRPWWGLPGLGLPSCFLLPVVLLTHPAPPGSDSAAPPGGRFPASVPAKEGVRDPWLCLFPSPMTELLLQGQVHSFDFFRILQTHTDKERRGRNRSRNLGSQREVKSNRNPERNLSVRNTMKRKAEMETHGKTRDSKDKGQREESPQETDELTQREAD